VLVVSGVVALTEQDRRELWTGGEVGAGFARGFHAAVELDGAGAQPVAEHAGVGLAAQPGHRCGLGDGEVLTVEGVDLDVDGGVLVGDDTVADAGVGEGHLHRAVAEEGSDRLQAHPSVDRLGGEGVAELVGVGADVGAAGDAAHDAVHGVTVEGATVVGDQAAVVADVVEVGGGPVGEQGDEVGVQGT
jgi:hypothetical protein